MAGGKLVHYVEDLGVIARSEMTSTPRGYREVALSTHPSMFLAIREDIT